MVFAPKTNQNLIYFLYITNILSSRHVKRKKGNSVALSTSKFSILTFKRMYYDQWGEFRFLVRNLGL